MNTRVIAKGQPDKYGKTIGSSRKLIKSADKHFNYDEYLGDIYDSDGSNADYWSREEYNEMVETARSIFYPAVQKAANACHFTVSDNEAEYVAEKCVRYFFDNASWDEAVNRPEEYYVNSSRKQIKSSVRDDFAKGLQMIMKHEGVEFSNGTLEDNMIDIYDNYVSQFYEDELEEEGGVKVATDWFRNTYPDDEEGIFIHNSRKPIKSDYHNKEIYREAFASLIKDSDAQDFDNGDYGIVHYPGFYRILVDGTYETEFSAETDEEAIQKFKDYFANKKKDINNSRKSIKSSLEDRLIPYLEEFEEGFADTQITAPGDEMDIPSRQETFFEIFKNDHNLTDEDINKLKDAVMDIWEATAGD